MRSRRHFFTLNRRYDEGIAVCTARPSRWIRSLYSARSELGINLMRMGQDEEAFSSSKTASNNGFQDRLPATP